MSAVLLSFIGSKDPFWTPPGGQPQVGPLLSLLQNRTFDEVRLFFNLGDSWNHRAGEIVAACQKASRREKIHYHPLEIFDVSDHVELYRVMNHECQTILTAYRNQKAKFWVATASGTPAMQTVWVLLAQSGLFPARLLVTTPPQFLRPGQSPVREVELALDDFPQIQSPNEAKRQLSLFQAQIETLKTQNAVLQAQASAPIEWPKDGLNLRETLRQHEIALYRLALQQATGNAAQAARLLQVEPHTFRKRAVNLGIWERKSTKA